MLSVFLFALTTAHPYTYPFFLFARSFQQRTSPLCLRRLAFHFVIAPSCLPGFTSLTTPLRRISWTADRFTMADLTFVINHVVFPPNLPNSDEAVDVRQKGEARLLDLVFQTAVAFVKSNDDETREGWLPVIDSLRNARNLQQNPGLCRETLQLILTNLKTSGSFTSN